MFSHVCFICTCTWVSLRECSHRNTLIASIHLQNVANLRTVYGSINNIYRPMNNTLCVVYVTSSQHQQENPKQTEKVTNIVEALKHTFQSTIFVFSLSHQNDLFTD